MTNDTAKPDEDKGVREPHADYGMKRRGDNVGQSGRWRAANDPGEAYAKNESGGQSTPTPASGHPHEDNERRPNADKPNVSDYRGGYAASGESDAVDDKSKYDSGAYAEAGGVDGPSAPAGSDEWEDQAGAGFGESYGAGREAAEDKDDRG